MPAGAGRTTVMQGSTPLAAVNGRRVQISGPLPPGSTQLNVGTQIPVTSGTFELEQPFPAAVDQMAVIVQKVGDVKMSSPQILEQREIAAQGQTYIAGPTSPVAAGQPLRVSLADMPHHSPVPRRIAIALALVIVGGGVWAGTRPRKDVASVAAERKRLVARRERLLAELVRLERDQRNDPRYSSRREEILGALEHVYGALDSDDITPGPGNSAGVAA
jgi:hypothetical protein